VGLAYAARTVQELAGLARDLPGDSARLPPTPVSEQHRAFCSHLVRRGPWSLPCRSSWRSIFGTIDLDLRQARLADSDSVLEVYNLFGTVTVIVPDGVEVVVRGGGLFASQKIESPERPPIADGPRLTIDTRGAGGTLHVRGRPTPPTLKQSIKAAKQSIKKALK
jgi:Cell wall-active antibiotics response 4TMS YvqF